VNAPERRVQPAPPGQEGKHASPIAPTRPGEASRQDNKPRELKQKKVWRVITTEQGGEKDQKEKSNKDHRGK